jgi:20S proteasome alpha/beta subunit
MHAIITSPAGVLIASDTLASYGTLARFKDVNRVGAYGSHTIVGAAGDLSDFQVCQLSSKVFAFLPYLF